MSIEIGNFLALAICSHSKNCSAPFYEAQNPLYPQIPALDDKTMTEFVVQILEGDLEGWFWRATKLPDGSNELTSEFESVVLVRKDMKANGFLNNIAGQFSLASLVLKYASVHLIYVGAECGFAHIPNGYGVCLGLDAALMEVV
ncbi:hypothetical protein EG327_010415 [Venturia inaequalis]|uniref:Uncharacterized protein n=1 Tax=Venturia inaequalis TaxID=5025 RepID=A0A8H3YQR4_VENIN|nr:hypothetical protein EG327_010415 [Venturia inaequalis]